MPSNAEVIEEFRAHGGRVGGWFAGAPLVLLTTAGRRTGRPHTTPAVYRRDGDRYLVFGSERGRTGAPAEVPQHADRPAGHNAAEVRDKVDRVVAELEEHFVYEEEHLLPALGVTRPAA